MPYRNGKLQTYLTTQNQNSLTSIKVVFEDQTVKEYNLTFKETKQNIAIYTINDFDLEYAFNNYTIKEAASIVETIKNYISNVNYATTLDPLTASRDSRLYRDHYNEMMKPLAEEITLHLLQNDGNSILNMDSELLNNKIKQELIDSGRLDKILYAYNYYHRWYHFEIGGAKVSDLLFFEGKMYKDSMTIDNLTEEVLTGNLGTNATHTFFANSLSKYTGSSALTYYLDGVIRNIGGYEDINDWFTEHFSSIGILAEIPVENHPEVKYRAWDRLKGFIFRAGKVIVVLVAALCFLNSLGIDGSFGNEDSDKSVLSQIGKTIVPVFKPMGVSEENWPAAVGIFTGILAKEAVVGTLDSLYSGMGGKDEETAAEGGPAAAIEEKAEAAEEEGGFNFMNSLNEAVASIGEGFGDIGAFFSDPLGISVDSDLSDVEKQAEEQEVAAGTIQAMNKLYDGELGAFAYLLMVLLYLPCGAAMGAVYREVGSKWALFAAGWTTVLGYCSATLVYQVGRFSSNPTYASICIAVCVALIAAVVVGLRMAANNEDRGTGETVLAR